MILTKNEHDLVEAASSENRKLGRPGTVRVVRIVTYPRHPRTPGYINIIADSPCNSRFKNLSPQYLPAYFNRRFPTLLLEWEMSKVVNSERDKSGREITLYHIMHNLLGYDENKIYDPIMKYAFGNGSPNILNHLVYKIVLGNGKPNIFNNFIYQNLFKNVSLNFRTQIERAQTQYYRFNDKKLSEIEARREFICKSYVNSAKETASYEKLVQMVQEGKNIQLLCRFVKPYSSAYDPDGSVLKTIFDDTTFPFAHPYILAGMLTDKKVWEW
jgi:hypothetical protein